LLFADESVFGVCVFALVGMRFVHIALFLYWFWRKQQLKRTV